MPDLRYDPIFDQWTVIAENRRDRPIDFLPIEQIRTHLICPFCSGNEDETPPAVLMLGDDGQPLASLGDQDWMSRVIPNKFSAFDPGQCRGPVEPGPYGVGNGAGLQELIIPSPRHVASLSELQDVEISVGLQAAQMRIRAYREDPAIQHAMFFKNCRYEAGASVEHVHFQLIGSPVVSSTLRQRSERFAEQVKCQGCFALEPIRRFEADRGVRVIGSTSHWLAFCPFASRHAFQIWIAPRRTGIPFCEMPVEALREVADLMQGFVLRLETLLGMPGYNLMLHQLPFAAESADDWFFELFPRLAKIAGYEIGTDIWINPVSPEAAARRLR